MISEVADAVITGTPVPPVCPAESIPVTVVTDEVPADKLMVLTIVLPVAERASIVPAMVPVLPVPPYLRVRAAAVLFTASAEPAVTESSSVGVPSELMVNVAVAVDWSVAEMPLSTIRRAMVCVGTSVAVCDMPTEVLLN